MQFLIDGYNLMHFLGLARPRESNALAKSRKDLQEWLHKAHGRQVKDVAIVFDGRVFDLRQTEIQTDKGLQIVFSVGQSADDVIEEIIKRQAVPKRLTVVSSDRRILDAGRRRGCVAWNCSDYLDWVLEQGYEPPKPPRPPEKPTATGEENARWMKEFGGIDDDPEVKKSNRMYKDFGAM